MERYVKKRVVETPNWLKSTGQLTRLSALGLELTFLTNSKKKETCVLWAIYCELIELRARISLNISWPKCKVCYYLRTVLAIAVIRIINYALPELNSFQKQNKFSTRTTYVIFFHWESFSLRLSNTFIINADKLKYLWRTQRWTTLATFWAPTQPGEQVYPCIKVVLPFPELKCTEQFVPKQIKPSLEN